MPNVGPQRPTHSQSVEAARNTLIRSDVAVNELINKTLPGVLALAEELECPMLAATAIHLAEHQATVQARLAGML